MGRQTARKAKRAESPEQVEARKVRLRLIAVNNKADAVGVPDAPSARFGLELATVKLDAHGERGGGSTVRRMADPLDRLKAKDYITQRQYAAGEWWRESVQSRDA